MNLQKLTFNYFHDDFSFFKINVFKFKCCIIILFGNSKFLEQILHVYDSVQSP